MLLANKIEYLQGGVKIPTGGKVRERFGAESVQLRYRQYSLDGRRFVLFDALFYALRVYSQGVFLI